MPGVVKVKVMSARDLPIMDRSSELTDAFVEVCVCVCVCASSMKNLDPFDCSCVWERTTNVLKCVPRL